MSHDNNHISDKLTKSDEQSLAALESVGHSPEIAAELHRRLLIIENDENSEDSRRPLSGLELAGYVGLTVVLCIIGLVMI